MIAVKDYLARQLSGLRVLQIAEGISQAFNRYIPYLEYVSSISIDSAQEVELEQLGTIIGYTRPLVPNSIILDKVFTFTSVVTAPTYSETGFSGTGIDGGNFSPLNLVLDSNKMSLAQYKQVLVALAQLKWGKFSVQSIAKIAYVFHPIFDIVYKTDHDIIIRYAKDPLAVLSISNTNLYLANSIFQKFFNSSPKVTATRVS